MVSHNILLFCKIHYITLPGKALKEKKTMKGRESELENYER